MRTIISILIVLVLAGCAVQKKEMTPAERQKIKEAVIQRLYDEHRLRKAEEEMERRYKIKDKD